MEVARVDDQEIDAHVASSLLHAAGKGGKVAPVSAIVLFLQMTLEPSMGIGLAKKLSAAVACAMRGT